MRLRRLFWGLLYAALGVFVAAVISSVAAEQFDPGTPPANKFSDRWPPVPAQPPKPLDWTTEHRLYTPADATRAVALDSSALANTLDIEEIRHVRYLSLHNIPFELRDLYTSEIGKVVNSLSRKRNITPPLQLGPDDIILRVNLRDYDIDPNDWDKMGDTDPYFHQGVLQKLLKVREITTTITDLQDWPGGVDPKDGKYYEPGKYKVEKEVVKKVTEEVGDPIKLRVVGASWLDADAMTVILKNLYPPLEDAKLPKQQTPILRGDWFLANAMLPPFYYDLLRLKTLEDFNELVLFDKRSKKTTDAKATVVFSGSHGLARRVARNNRILERFNTAYGAYWQTFDFKTSVKKQNVIHNFLNEERDGGELIGTLPNGLQVYFLVNNKDERVDEVPIDIAVDSLAQDARVRNGRSCMWCHSQGIQPFRSDFKLTITPDGLNDLGIQVKDRIEAVNLARQIREQFGDPDFRAIVKADNVRYNNAVRTATITKKQPQGRTAVASAALFLQLYDDYAEVPMEPERLVYEAGVSDLDVQAAIRVHINGSSNGVLLRRLAEPPLQIRRDQWEEVYDDFMLRVISWQKARDQAVQDLKKAQAEAAKVQYRKKAKVKAKEGAK